MTLNQKRLKIINVLIISRYKTASSQYTMNTDDNGITLLDEKEIIKIFGML